MKEQEFFHSTLKYINERVEIYRESKEYEAKQIEYLAWAIGKYTMPAVGVVFDTKHRIKYPKNPLAEKEVVVENMSLTEEEKEEWSMKWMKRLQKMAKKYEKKENP